MFHSADVALVTKSDLADAVDFDRDAALAALNKMCIRDRMGSLKRDK